MISRVPSCFPNVAQSSKLYSVTDDVVSSSLEASSSAAGTHSNSLLYSLSMLKDKVNQAQSLVAVLISSDSHNHPESTSIAVANMGSLVQEIIATASSMLFTCQQMNLGSTPCNINTNELHQQHVKIPDGGLSQPNFDRNRFGNTGEERGQGDLYSTVSFDNWYGHENYFNYGTNENNQGMHTSNDNRVETKELSRGAETSEGSQGASPNSSVDIIELNAADLLAKYTHYCQVCGKGFKRDANLRMHMRAHGEEYKTSAALTNPLKTINGGAAMGNNDSTMTITRKYSCPQEGCRWNQKHAKFQPLKSMICVKNHYKRSHCPKMYVCKRCNRKQFSVLSDLRTHEKHCGDLKWQCSCGTTFSRKDKLMGHVALFVGHVPVINDSKKTGKS